MAKAEELLSELVYAIDDHREAKRRWQRLDMRRPSDRIRKAEICERFISATDRLFKAEDAARLHMAGGGLKND